MSSELFGNRIEFANPGAKLIVMFNAKDGRFVYGVEPSNNRISLTIAEQAQLTAFIDSKTPRAAGPNVRPVYMRSPEDIESVTRIAPQPFKTQD